MLSEKCFVIVRGIRGIMMQHKWKYFIILNDGSFPNDMIDMKETVDGELPLCCDFNIAINSDSRKNYRSGLKDYTSLSLENSDSRIEGRCLPE